jgi:hypothetical protein
MPGYLVSTYKKPCIDSLTIRVLAAWSFYACVRFPVAWTMRTLTMLPGFSLSEEEAIGG